MTEKTIDWLNGNRFISYPFENDVGIICNGAHVPNCILLDCLVVDTRPNALLPELIVTRYSVMDDHTDVYFRYGGTVSHCTIQDTDGSSTSDSSPQSDIIGNDIVKVVGTSLDNLGNPMISLVFVFSSHRYIREAVGIGNWEFSGRVLPSKILSTNASGVLGVKTQGSAETGPAGTATGIISLVDGYRTQPCIHNGKIVVRVGTSFGLDLCHYPIREDARTACRDKLLFFCGQNAINGGNVVIAGGPGINVSQGTSYTAKTDIYDTYGKVGIAAGESVPCIEITATSELLNMYNPSTESSS